MKSIIALVSFLVVAAACTPPPPTDTKTPANANTVVTAGISEVDVTAKEKGVWEALKKKDFDAFSNMLASDYLEVEDDGVYDKTTTNTTIRNLVLSDATFSDWKILTINKDAVLVTYNLNLTATYNGTTVPPGPYRVASAWVNRDGQWLEGYYQETLAKTTTPPTTLPTTPVNSPSPAAKAVETVTSSDVVANEKMVWDALKSKNFERFAALLAPDAVEVEPDGVYAKADSVKGVSSFDFSKTILSDWKTTKLDNDALLVAYLVTIPGGKPDKEHHSSIWVNRNGKWMVFFHQGTPIAVPGAGAKPEKKK